MSPRDDTLAPEMASPSGPAAADSSGQLARFAAGATLLTLGFGVTLYQLTRLSLSTDLYSHVVLIPFISGYLIWQRRNERPARFKADPTVAVLPIVLGFAALAGYWMSVGLGLKLAREDGLALTTLSYLLLLLGLAGATLGRETLRTFVFPISFLVFMVPMPIFLNEAVEAFLQHGSAELSYPLFKLVGTPIFREGLVFQLPGITLQVAPECSGIRSTLALFITSILAANFFLRSPVRRVILVLAVVPLALMRNAVRIFVIGELCVHISPDMIHSYIHRHGGPIFFALSLIPFFLLLVVLRKSEPPVTNTGRLPQ